MSFELVTAFSGERVCAALGDGDRYVGSIGNCADSFLKISSMIYPMTILKGTFKSKTKTQKVQFYEELMRNICLCSFNCMSLSVFLEITYQIPI